MSNYYQKQDSKVAIMSVLAEKGWAIFGYKPDESDSMTDYWSPARWNGIASKNGFVLVVDQYSTHYSGYEVKTYNYNEKGTSADIYAKIQKLQATLNDNASTDNEKEVCKTKIEALENKEGVKPTYTVKETYPTFAFANPKTCTWHIEKDGEIIAKGKGLTNIYECNSRENTRINAEKFVSKIEEKINGFDSLVPVEKKVIKKVIKPVEVTNRKELQIGDILSFEYHGHYWEVYNVSETTFSYELLGSEKRGFQKLKNGKRYYDTMKSFNKNIENGRIKIYEIKEVEDVTYKTVYVKSKRKGQQENLLSTEDVTPVTENTETIVNDNISLEVVENTEKQGIELYFASKPSKNVISILKDNGFRWHRNGFWYARKSDERMVVVESIQSILLEVNEKIEKINNEVAGQTQPESKKENICITEDEKERYENLESYHIELQERGMKLTESKPVVNENSMYKVIVSKDRENNLIGEFEKVLSSKDLEFQLSMNEVLEIIEEVQTSSSGNSDDQLESLETELKQLENDISTQYQMFVGASNSRSASELTKMADMKQKAKQLRTSILKVKSNSMGQLFSNSSLTDGQNYRINILVNKWKDGTKYEFKAVYKDTSHESNVILHATGKNGYKAYFVICEDGSAFSKNSIDSIFDKVELIHDFDNNNSEINKYKETNVTVNGSESESENHHITEHEKERSTFSYNEERNSIEITFNEKPSEEIRSLLKANGFRWARINKVWYKKSPTESDFAFVESLGGSKTSYNSDSNFEPSYPEIDINDIETYVIPQDIQDREHESNWVTRTVKRDHNKDIQDTFKNVQERVIEVLSTTDNKHTQHELKRSLQYFKKHYYASYMKWISGKANNPSWITTGRGNLNVSRYNKKMDQINNHMLKLSELQAEMEDRIEKAERRIWKDEKDRITAEIEKCGLDIQFKMETKEFVYMGTTDKRKVHCYQDYWIVKCYGCFRVFKGNKELHSCKTTEKLEHAKKYVAYHIEKEKLEKAV